MSAALPLSFENTAAFAAVECNMITPCTAPPPNGAPRYVLPSSQYDPARRAEERFAKALVLEEEATKKRNFEMMKMKAEEEEEKEEEASKAPEEEVVDSSTDSTASSSSFEE